MTDFEYYATPLAFTRYLYWAMARRGAPIAGRCFEPCVGDGEILRAGIPEEIRGVDVGRRQWTSNDLDQRWPAGRYGDATLPTTRYGIDADWVPSNPPFTPALAIIEHALRCAKVGVAMHLRASIHEVLKKGVRRTWMRDHRPTGILWLPRFAYQRSPKTGHWTTDSVGACWLIWLQDPAAPQFIDYAPEWVIDELKTETRTYRERMDAIMGDREAPRLGDVFAGEIT